MTDITNPSPIHYDIINHKFHSTEPIIFIGNGNIDFGKRVAKYFQPSCVSSCCVERFADGEIKIPNISENIRQRDCVIIQTCAHSSQPQTGTVNEHWMELLVLVDALKRANARTVTVVMPIYPYQRQDRKPCSRAPITASLIARTLEMLAVDRVITFDLHAGQIQGFFHQTPLDNLYSEPYFIRYINNLFNDSCAWDKKDLVIVSPDEGGVKRATRVSKKLGCPMAMLYKDRTAPNQVGDMILMGNVRGRICVIIDDMIDTAGTACKAADILRKHGADNIYLCACHGVLSGPALDRIANSVIDRVVVTNTMEIYERFNTQLVDPNIGIGLSKIDVLDVSEMCACAIERSLTGRSISELMSIE